MADKTCNVCDQGLSAPIYANNERTSITSLREIIEGGTTVYLCESCCHIQTSALDNLSEYYDRSYELLTNSEEEDQIYGITNNEKIFRYDHQAKTLLSLINIPQGARILDYGCAKGTTLKKVIRQRQDIQPFFFDITDRYLPFWESFLAKDRYATYTIPNAWIDSFDIVTSFFSLEHADKPGELLQEVRSVLKKDGVLYVVVPNVLENIADFIVVDHINHFTSTSLSHLFERNGFEIMKIDENSHRFSYIVIAKKSHPDSITASAAEPAKDDAIKSQARSSADYWRDISVKIAEFENKLPPNTKYAIYGSGFYGVFILTRLKNKRGLTCFLDRDPFRQKHELAGKRILDPKNLPDDMRTIFVGLNPKIAQESIKMLNWDRTNLNLFYL